jgi:hypothetical protein
MKASTWRSTEKQISSAKTEACRSAGDDSARAEGLARTLTRLSPKATVDGGVLRSFLRVGIFLWLSWTASATFAQNIVVDAAPSHVANTFSPFRSLGAAIDRLKTGTPDHLLTDPVLKEIAPAGKL